MWVCVYVLVNAVDKIGWLYINQAFCAFVLEAKRVYSRKNRWQAIETRESKRNKGERERR